MLKTSGSINKTIWVEDQRVYIIEQTLLPAQNQIIEVRTVDEMVDAIKRLAVRGAPAIGIAAAFGMFIAAKQSVKISIDVMLADLNKAHDKLLASRPTAVNLAWALNRIQLVINTELQTGTTPSQLQENLLLESNRILNEDDNCCKAIGRHGAELLKCGDTVLTHCNAGGLATASYGTALAPIYYAVEEQLKSISVYADETRPLLQGARLTAWELSNRNISVTVICDNMAATVLSSRKINVIIVGADRIAGNGDVANKIGTLGLAIIANHYNIPFYVAAPLSTFDFSLSSGNQIPIEERNPDEIRFSNKTQSVPDQAKIYNPAFDVTPHSLIQAYITENGVYTSVEKVAKSRKIR